MSFARFWIEAWNRHDLEAVLRLFATEATFSSPLIQSLGISADGMVRGKEALRAYWTLGLSKVPDLHFDLVSVSQGIDLIAIIFRNQQGAERCEVLKFSNNLVIEGHGTYPV